MAAGGRPSVRSRHMKNMVEAVDRLPAGRSRALLAAFEPDDVRLVRESSPTEWLEVGVNLRMTETIWTTSDPAAREQFFRALAAGDFESSYLKSLVTSALQLFGPSPGHLIKWVPRGWPAMFRDCGEVEATDVTDETARLVYSGLPPVLASSAVWIHSVRASLGTLLDVARRSGQVTLEQHDPAARRAVLLFRWQGA